MKEENETIPASPDQMTDHLRVTYVPTYLLAAAVALLFAAFIVRGVLGSVSDKVYYSGIRDRWSPWYLSAREAKVKINYDPL